MCCNWKKNLDDIAIVLQGIPSLDYLDFYNCAEITILRSLYDWAAVFGSNPTSLLDFLPLLNFRS